jgi:glycosyltransferase involved in cell wall biosynthesis
MKTLSIIIPFLNEEKTLNQILEKIFNLSDFSFKKEIILINDGSTDKSEKIVLSYLDKNIENTNFIYIKNETNK